MRALRGAGLIVAAAAFLAACGSSSPSTSSGGTGGGTQATSTTSAGSTTSSPASTAPTVKTASSKLGTILVDSKGFTLYRYTKDSKNKSTCTGGCASTWPPLLVTGSGSPVGQGVSGLGTIPAAHGRQVTYNGEPLYTYAGDSAAGQTNGQGVGGTWFVVTTSGSTPGSGSGSSGGGAGSPGGGY